MCLCLHAEENALLEAGRERIGIDSILYCNTCDWLAPSVIRVLHTDSTCLPTSSKMPLPELRHQDRTSLILSFASLDVQLTSPRAPLQVQSGVKEVVYNLAYAMDEESARILKEGGVHLRRLRPGGPAEEAP